MEHIIERVYRFLLEYIDERGVLIYLEKIDEMISEEHRSLYVNLLHLESFDPVVVDEIITSPKTGLTAASDALKQVLLGKEPEFLARMQNRLHLRFINPPDRIKKSLRKIRSAALGTLLYTEAIITKSTEVKPYLEVASFRCIRCQALQPSIRFTEGEYNPPFSCINATNHNDPCTNKIFTLLKDQSTFIDFQRVSLQEKPEELPSGQMPESLTMFMRDDLCDLIRPGDRVKVVGIMESRTDNVLTRGKMPLFLKYVEGVSILKETEEYTDIEISEEDERAIRDLSENPNVHRMIRNSIAPIIFGALEEKEAISYLLFGGTTKKSKDGTKIRGESNILLIGDPGMGKCVHPNTELLLSTGERLTIGEYVDRNISSLHVISDGYYDHVNTNVVSINLKGKIQTKTSDIIWKRKSPAYLYNITTHGGRTITVTDTHPFFTIKEGIISSIQAKNLIKNSFIAVPRRIIIPGKNELNVQFRKNESSNKTKVIVPKEIYPWFAQFLGLILTEGTSNSNFMNITDISFKNTNEKLVETFKVSLTNLGVDFNTRIKDNTLELYCKSPDLYDFLETIDPCIVTKSAEKRVPNILMKATNNIVSVFLQSFFDGEAKVRKASSSIQVRSKSFKMLSDIQLLLLRFEILSQITTKYIDDQLYFRLIITGKSNLRKYMQTISFTNLNKKQKLTNSLLNLRKINKNLDIIPDLLHSLNTLKTKNNLFQREFNIPTTITINYDFGEQYLSRSSLQEITSVLKNVLHNPAELHIVNRYESLALSDIFWDKIAKVEQIQSDTEWVYDLQVPEFHNFVANNIIIHNSQILKSVADLVPRGLYTSGRGSSAAGLTASVIRDPETGEMTLEAGAVVLADKGIAFIDEFDKMRKEDRSALHESMEQHSVSIAKAGIVATLNARTSILAAANPKLGRWDSKKDAIDNLNLPSTIISRFDLIFPIIDKPNRTEDELKASHILKIHQQVDEPEGDEESLNKIFLRKYISYARKNIHPTLSNDAREEIMKFYLDLREGKGLEAAVSDYGGEQGLAQQAQKPRTIAITPRQLESLIRLSEARAKIALRAEVTREDAVRVIELFKQSLNRVTKGDIDSLYGMSSQKRNKRETILNILVNLSQGDAAPDMDDILRKGREEGLDDGDVRDMIDQLLQNGEIYEPRPGTFKKMSD